LTAMPTKPITAKPTSVANAIFWNSGRIKERRKRMSKGQGQPKNRTGLLSLACSSFAPRISCPWRIPTTGPGRRRWLAPCDLLLTTVDSQSWSTPFSTAFAPPMAFWKPGTVAPGSDEPRRGVDASVEREEGGEDAGARLLYQPAAPAFASLSIQQQRARLPVFQVSASSPRPALALPSS
jgi:hypothetical protein